MKPNRNLKNQIRILEIDEPPFKKMKEMHKRTMIQILHERSIIKLEQIEERKKALLKELKELENLKHEWNTIRIKTDTTQHQTKEKIKK